MQQCNIIQHFETRDTGLLNTLSLYLTWALIGRPTGP